MKRLKKLEKEKERLREAVSDLTLEKLILKEAAIQETSEPSRRRQCIEHITKKHGVEERLACRVLGQHRSTQRRVPKGRVDQAALTAEIVELAAKYGQYGYPSPTRDCSQSLIGAGS